MPMSYAKSSQHKPNCPSCEGRLYRVPRHFFDLVVSKFVPVRRYRCFSVACCWEGTLRHQPVAGRSAVLAASDERRYTL